VNHLTDQQLFTGLRSKLLGSKLFAELARRHVDFVYSTALRMLHDRHLAEDVTQSVFVALARDAVQLGDRHSLAGWLYRTTQNLAANARPHERTPSRPANRRLLS